MADVCLKCQHIHVAGEAVALSRFTGVTGYRTPDGEIHATREDAQEWLCEQRQQGLRGTGCGRRVRRLAGAPVTRRNALLAVYALAAVVAAVWVWSL